MNGTSPDAPDGRRATAARSLSQAGALDRLRRARQRLAQGPRLLALAGAAGSGKSWLLRRFRDESPHLAPLVETPPLVPSLLRAARPLLAEERHPDFVVAAQGLWPGGPWSRTVAGATTLSREGLELHVVQALVRAAERTGGLCLCLEDLHAWRPEDLAGFRRFWRRALLARAPLLLLATTRALDEGWWDGARRDAAALEGAEPEVVRLLPLSADETRDLVGEALNDADPPAALVAWVHDRAQGLPLHALELVRFLVQGGALVQRGAVWLFREPASPSLPSPLSSLVAARLRETPVDSDTRRVLTLLAVLERGAAVGELAAFLDLPASVLAELCADAERQGLLRGDLREGEPRVALASPLLGPPLLRNLDAGRLRELHERVALRTGDPFERARHARRARHPDAGAWMREALEIAYRRNDHAELRRNAEALLASGEPADASRLHLYAGLAAHAVGDLPAALEHLGRSEEPAAVELRILPLIRLARYEEALDAVRAALPRLPEGDRAFLEGREIGMLLATGRIEEAESLVRERLERAPPGSRLRAEVLVEKARLHERRREYEAQLEAASQALAAYERDPGLPRNRIAWSFAGTAARRLGRWDLARKHIGSYLRDAEEHGDAPALSAGAINLGTIATDEEAPAEAERRFRDALRIAEAYDQRFEAAQAWANLAGALVDLGRLDEAVRGGERALDLHRELGHVHFASFDLSLLACAEGLRGEGARAAERLAELDATDRAFAVPAWTATALLVLGREEEAFPLLGPPPAGATGGAARPHVLRGLAELSAGRPAAARDAFAAALERSRTVGQPLSEREARLGMAIAEAREGGRGAATTLRGAEALEALAGSGAPGRLRVFELLFPDELAAFRAAATAAAATGPAPAPFLRAFGGLELERGGEPAPWKGRKPRELLACLLTAAIGDRGSVPREELLAFLWPDAPEAQAGASFRVTVQRLRRTLGAPDAIARSADGRYRLQGIGSDVARFLEAASRYDPEAALGWYRGEFLAGLQVPGVEGVREHLRRRFREAAHHLALEAPPARAAELFERLLADDPFDLEALLGLARALERLQETGALRRQVGRYVALYRDELGEVPDELREAALRAGLDPLALPDETPSP